MDLNFSGRKIKNKNFSGANLTGADFSMAVIVNTNFDGANLTHANFTKARFKNSTLVGAILKEANLQGASLRGINLKGADLAGANLNGVELLDAITEGYKTGNASVPFDRNFLHYNRCKGRKIISFQCPQCKETQTIHNPNYVLDSEVKLTSQSITFEKQATITPGKVAAARIGTWFGGVVLGIGMGIGTGLLLGTSHLPFPVLFIVGLLSFGAVGGAIEATLLRRSTQTLKVFLYACKTCSSKSIPILANKKGAYYGEVIH